MAPWKFFLGLSKIGNFAQEKNCFWHRFFDSFADLIFFHPTCFLYLYKYAHIDVFEMRCCATCVVARTVTKDFFKVVVIHALIATGMN